MSCFSVEKMSEKVASNNMNQWIKENEADFRPPVCNKCMFSDQLKVFYVGGPNERSDYHIEEGEEIFYQIKGDMCLKVVEKGVKKDIIIKEGEMFVLPAKIPHSPLRFKSTVGCVVERTRAEFEKDGLCYFIDDTITPLYERYFHLNDIVKDIPPFIKDFFLSDAYKYGKPTLRSVIESDRPYEMNCEAELEKPFNLKQWIESNMNTVELGGFLIIFGAPKFTCEIIVYSEGKYKIEAKMGETLILNFVGINPTNLVVEGKCIIVGNGEIVRISENTCFEMNIEKVGAFCVTIRMPTPKISK